MLRILLVAALFMVPGIQVLAVSPPGFLMDQVDNEFEQIHREYEQALDAAMRHYEQQVADTQAWYEQRLSEIQKERFDKDADYGNRLVAELNAQRDQAYQDHINEYNEAVEAARQDYYQKANEICWRQTGQDCVWE